MPKGRLNALLYLTGEDKLARRITLAGWAMFGSSGCDMSAAATTSTITGVNNDDNIGIIASWTGTSPVGVLIIEASNDYNATTSTAGTWVTLDFGSSIAISGNTGSHQININQLPYSYLRATYTKTSGTGTLKLYMTSKSVGA